MWSSGAIPPGARVKGAAKLGVKWLDKMNKKYILCCQKFLQIF